MYSSKAKKRISLRIYALFTLTFLLASLLLIVISGYIKSTRAGQGSNASLSSDTVVIIDAGHGGEDGGAVGVDGTVEKHINLSIAIKLSEALNAAGIPTRLTRDRDEMLYDRNEDFEGRKKALDLAKRLEIAQEYEKAIFVSIHMNSFPQEKYSGLQVYYSDNSPISKQLAECIQERTRELLMPENRRGVKSAGESIYLLRKIEYPAVLIECGFLSNRDECARLSTDAYQRQLAISIYDAIIKYLSSEKIAY